MPIAFVQANSAAPQSPSSSLAVTFTAAQSAGDLSAVIVGWNDTVAQVTSVTDSKGNAYQRAVGPTARPGVLTQSIYYATNIAAAAAGANAVTVTFSPAAQFADVRILEYSGIDAADALDVTAAAAGSSATSSTAAVATTFANDLLVAGNMVATSTRAAGTGFTRRVITVPDGDLAEDRIVAAAGSYASSATLDASGDWVMQMAAFKAIHTSTPDTQPPTAPANLTATAVSATRIDLGWAASTDNVGVTGYLVEECLGTGCTFAQIGTSTATSFNHTGLTAGSTHSYRVRATDAAGNLGGYSPAATATTPAPDTQPPTAPSGLTATAASSTQVNLGWTASTDNVAVTAYLVERCSGVGCATGFAQIASVAAPNASDTGVSGGATYGYRVRATDAAGNPGPYSNVASATTPVAPTLPTFVQGAYATPQSAVATVSVGYAAAQQGGNLNVVVVGWNDAVAQVLSVNDASGNSYALAVGPTVATGLSQSIYYASGIVAAGAGNAVTVRFTSAAAFPDIRILEYSGIAASSPVDAVASGNGASATSSTPATTTTGSVDLLVAANMVQTATASAGAGFTSRMISSPDGDIALDRVVTAPGSWTASAALTAAGGWVMQMVAFKAGGGAPPPPPPPPDTQPPTAPASLAATAVSSGQIDLTWTASTDDVAVTSYLIERCSGASCASFVQVATTTSAGLTSSGLAGGTAYSFRVRAADAAGNLSAFSNVASATTPPSTALPAFVQSNFATPQSTSATVSVAFAAAQRAGDLNVIAVGWNDAVAQVTSVADASGNAYALAVGPTVVSAGLSHSIYYASGIAAAAAGNTVTVRFSPAAAFPDVRILEYSGIVAASPVDVTAVATGNSASSGTSPVSTTNTLDLLFAANLVATATSAAGSGFTNRVITTPDGDIAEDRVVTSIGAYGSSAGLTAAGGWVMQMVAFKGSGAVPPPDTTPPSVTVTSPAGGASLSGTVTIAVSATDSASQVVAAQLLVDGIPVGVPDTVGPYSFSLDTAQFPNGAHAIGASAWDGAHNAGSAVGVAVTFTNAGAGDPASTGLWSGTVPLPIVPVHQALLPEGKVLMFDGQSLGNDARVWDPATGASLSVPAPANLFCSAHEQMADGRIFVPGGHAGAAHVGLTAANLFDPTTQVWTVLPDMAFPRWYPTATALPDGRLLVLAGESTCDGCEVLTPEIYDPALNRWTQLSGAQFSFPYYPHVFVLPDGRVLVPSTGEEPIVSQVLDVSHQTWTALGGAAVDGGSAVMYLPWKFLKTGTSVDPDQPRRTSQSTAFVLDMTQPSPVWRPVAAMSFARTYHTLTSLPDGTVLVTGGGPTTAATDTANAILTAELWSPATETFTRLSAMRAPRLYHSAALLLPDARVVVLGGGRFDDVTAASDQFNAEFYSPPYLFKGPRPQISSAPGALVYGQPFAVQTPDAARIASVSLVRYGSVTHAINMGQRFLPLAFTAGSGSLTVTAPVDRNLAPPGNYMLFLVDSNGVPSVAATVHL